MKILKPFLIISLLGLVAISCKDDDNPATTKVEVPNEPEVFTTVIYTLTDEADNTNIATFKFQDKDGEGGDAPIITADNLKANTVYTGSLKYLDESGEEVEDKNVEIKGEELEHQVFFISTSDISVTYSDQDAEGNPIGLESKLTTTTANPSTLKIVLRHEPKKDAAGVKDGDITNAEGETDIEVDFAFEVEGAPVATIKAI